MEIRRGAMLVRNIWPLGSKKVLLRLLHLSVLLFFVLVVYTRSTVRANVHIRQPGWAAR